MDIKINPEDIESFVKESLIKSGIGKAVETAVQKVLAPNSYDNPIEKELRIYIGTVTHGLIHDKFGDKIKAAIDAYLETEITQDLVNKMTTQAVKKMIDAVRDY